MALKTTYTDAGYTGNRKYTMEQNTDGTVSFVDATEYNPKGSYFGAGDINATNKQINGISGSVTVKIPVAGWSSSTVTINGNAYYTYAASGLTIYEENPTVIIGAAGTLPTSSESAAFALIRYAIADISAGTITFYASAKPTTAIVAIVKGAS